jgi:hypothetical protein
MAPKKPDTKETDTASRGGTRAIDVIRHSYMGERRCITVLEWKDPQTGEPLDLWFSPITPSAMEKVDDRNPKTNLDRSLLLLVQMAQDEGGKPLFEFGDVRHIKDNTEFTVLQRVFDFMFSSLLEKVDAQQRIESDPTSGGASPSPSD